MIVKPPKEIAELEAAYKKKHRKLLRAERDSMARGALAELRETVSQLRKRLRRAELAWAEEQTGLKLR